MSIQDREHLEVTTANELYEWLLRSHGTSPGLWVVTYKKNSGKPAPSYDEIVRTLLCFGWVDSVPGKVDEVRTKLYVSPRKPKSAWSQSNKQRVNELLAEGLMQQAGLRAVESAKASGAWSLIDSAQDAVIPSELMQALGMFDQSLENFQSFPKGVRKQILEWIAQARTDETRQKRILETAKLAQHNIRANQWRGKNSHPQSS